MVVILVAAYASKVLLDSLQYQACKGRSRGTLRDRYAEDYVKEKLVGVQYTSAFGAVLSLFSYFILHKGILTVQQLVSVFQSLLLGKLSVETQNWLQARSHSFKNPAIQEIGNKVDILWLSHRASE